MLSQSRLIARRAPTAALRRNFSTTRAQFSSPYHYPTGPRSNLPFNPLSKYFFVKYWLFMGELMHARLVEDDGSGRRTEG
jgi:cytochrome c oxidase subunit 7c